jgi:hypothetical protein
MTAARVSPIQAVQDFSETTLLDMSGAEPAVSMTLRGFPYGIVRVR